MKTVFIFFVILHTVFVFTNGTIGKHYNCRSDDGLEEIFSEILTKWGHFDIVVVSNHTCPFGSLLTGFATFSTVNPVAFESIIFNEMIQNVSYSGEAPDFMIFDPWSQEQALGFIKLIGQIEARKLLPRVVTLLRTPIFFILWPNPLDKFLDLQQILAKTEMTDATPNLSSNILILLSTYDPNSASLNYGARHIYEYYVLDKNVILNPVPLTSFGKFMDSRRNFHGTKIRAAADLNRTSYHNDVQVTLASGVPVFTGGFSVNVMNILADDLNFRFQPVHETKDVSRDKNGNWQGIGKLLLEDETDIAMAKSAYNPMRGKDFTCLIPIFGNTIKIFFRQPQSSTVRNLLSLPFHSSLWLAILVIIISTIVLTKLVICLRDKVKLEHPDSIIIKDSFSWVFGFFCQNGWYVHPKVTWLRLTFVVCSATGLITFMSYSAILVSVLSTESVPVKTLLDLLQSSVKLIADVDSTTVRALLQSEANESMLHQKLDLHLTAYDGSKFVVDGAEPFGLITFPEVFYSSARAIPTITDASLCNCISSVNLTAIPFKAGIIVRKNSPYKEFFNNRIIHLRSSGLLDRWTRIYVSTYKPICDQTTQVKTPIDLDIWDLFTAYAIFLFGIVLSVMVLACEKLSARKTFIELQDYPE